MTRARDVADVQDNRGGAVPPFTAGKNKIINGDFSIWQRGTSFSGVGGYGIYNAADRFRVSSIGNSSTVSRQAFTLGSAPAAGYEADFFMRVATAASSMSYFDIGQAIEDVKAFSGQTVTFSFWAKAGAAGTTIMPQMIQNFGSGGSAQLATNAPSTIALTTSWTRYLATIAVPSVAGKTIGAGSWIGAYMAYSSGTINSVTIDTWGWQVEAGTAATPFTTATGTLQGEQDACERYLPTILDTNNYYTGGQRSTTNAIFPVTFRVKPRVAPTGITISAASDFLMMNSSLGGSTVTSLVFNGAGTSTAALDVGVTGGTGAAVGDSVFFRSQNSNAKILFTGCEL